MKQFRATIGERTAIKGPVYVDNVSEDANSTGTFEHLDIGRNCYVGDGVYFDLADRIVIGDDTMISGRVSFVTHSDCNRSAFLNERFPRQSAPIRIGRGAWIGFGVTLLHGITVGEEAVIGAESLVRENVPAREVWAGVPAKFIRKLS